MVMKFFYFFQKFSTSLINDNRDNKREFYQLLLRSQKLSERRGEGEVTEETDDGK